jgi:hypothetical protein
MKKISTLVTGALGLVALASACSVETAAPAPEGTASTEEGLVCSNAQAVNVVMAGLATSAALEMRRWLPERDFVFENGELKLSQWAPPRCPNRICKLTQNFLNLQKWEAHGMIIEGQALDVGVLRSRIATYWNRQMVCNSRPDNGFGDNCPVEYHDMVFTSRAPGSCDTDYWFHAPPMPPSSRTSSSGPDTRITHTSRSTCKATT